MPLIFPISTVIAQNFFYLQANALEYHRYLKEVVEALESDADFRSKLEKADEKDIRVSITLIYLY